MADVDVQVVENEQRWLFDVAHNPGAAAAPGSPLQRIQIVKGWMQGETLHERVWDGRDETGRTVPSGAYYARLVTAKRVDHIKMMLLK